MIAALHAESATARALARSGWRVLRSGVGPARAAAAARRLLAEGCTRLLVWGCAGGLDPELAPGALFLPERVLAPDLAALAVDAPWRDALAHGLAAGFASGTLASVAAPLATAAGKGALRARSGARAVDMETAAVAAVARAGGVPWAVVRAIADPADRGLPGVVLDAVGDRFLAPEVALRLVLHPRQAPAVVALGRDFARARAALGAAARGLAAAAGSRSLY